MSLCFGEAFRKKQYGDITKEDYIKSLLAHFRGLRHPTDHPDCVNEMIFVWNWDVFGDTIRDIALKTEYEPLTDTSTLEKHFCSCLTDDLETFILTLEEIRKQLPSLNFIQSSAVLAAYEQQPRIFKYCLDHGASLDHNLNKAIETPISSSSVPFRFDQSTKWSIPFLNALYEVDWQRIQSSRKALSKCLLSSSRFSPEIVAWFFDHGAKIAPECFQDMSRGLVSTAVVQDFLAKNSIDHFKHSGYLQRAAGTGATDLVKLLLDAGADINEGPVGRDEREPGPGPALQSAVICGHVETAKLLLERGADTRELYRIRYSDEPRTLAGRQHGEMAALLKMYEPPSLD